jgi:hypothetical protein
LTEQDFIKTQRLQENARKPAEELLQRDSLNKTIGSRGNSADINRPKFIDGFGRKSSKAVSIIDNLNKSKAHKSNENLYE